MYLSEKVSCIKPVVGEGWGEGECPRISQVHRLFRSRFTYPPRSAIVNTLAGL